MENPHETVFDEGPIAWRLFWQFVNHPRLETPHRAKPQFRDFPALEEAKREKGLLELRGELAGEFKPVLLVTAITRQGTTLLWPITLPDGSGRRNAWAETARAANQLAKVSWVRMVADIPFGAYRFYEAEGVLSEPLWPEKTLSELLEIGFKDRIIDSVDHPVIRRLRGLS